MLKSKPKSVSKERKKAREARAKQLWQLETGLTYSSLSKWIENPEEFRLSYIEGWTPRRLSKALEFGSIFHLMLEHQFVGRRKSPKTVAKEIASAYEANRAKTILKNERDLLHILCEQCKMLFPLYCDWWKQQDEDEGFEWIAREQQFSVPYNIIDHHGKQRTILLRGMRDGLFRDSGGYGIFETKTKDTIDQNAVRAQLKADMQTLLYAFTASKELKKIVPQVLYNVIRKPGQQYKNETVAEFVKRSQQDVEKRPGHYFMRWEVELSQRDYDNFEQRTLLPAIRNFLNWYDSLKKNPWESPFHFNNLNALVGRYGQTAYWDMITNGRQSMYYRRSSPFPELDKSSLLT